MIGVTYILKSTVKDRFYIGSSRRSVEMRLDEHNKGKVVSTKAYRPWVIAVSKVYTTYQEARSAELRLKALKRKDYIQRIVDDGYIRI